VAIWGVGVMRGRAFKRQSRFRTTHVNGSVTDGVFPGIEIWGQGRSGSNAVGPPP